MTQLGLGRRSGNGGHRCLWAAVVAALLVASGGFAADQPTDIALKKALDSRGISVVGIERTDDRLRVLVDNQAGYGGVVVAALVFGLAAPGAPPEGQIEVVATQDGRPLLRVTTPVAKAADFAKRNLSARRQEQLCGLLGESNSTPPAAVPAQPPVVINPSPKTPTAPPVVKPAGEIGQALVALGLENVRVVWRHDGDLDVHFENRTYRSDGDALGAVMQTVGQLVAPGTLVRVEPLRDEVSRGVFTFRAGAVAELNTGPVTGRQLAAAVTAGRDRSWLTWPDTVREQTPLLSPSRWRTDLLLRPGLEYAIGNERAPFESTLLLLPELTTTVGPGMRASVRGRADLGPWDFTIDRALMTGTGILGQNLLWTASVGKFREHAAGGFLEGQWVDSTDATRIGARLALAGMEFGRSDWNMAVGYVEHEFGELGLTARATFGRFLQTDSNDFVGTLERRFGESTVRISGALNDYKDRLFIGISMPLGGFKASKPDHFRIRSNPTADLDYASTSFPVGDDLGDAPDLRDFRGDLTLPYARTHPGHLFSDVTPVRRAERWVAPSFEGVTGLIRTPTADVMPDGRVALGTSWIPREQTSGLNAGASRSQPAFATLGFLPNLELTFRFTFYRDISSHFDGHDVNWPYDLDRSLAAQYRLVRQRDWLPSLAVGTQDIDAGDDSSKVGRATYLVASREEGPLDLHLGFGTGRFDGLFGGVELGLGDRVRLLGEYDTKDVNFGVRVRVLDCLTVDGAWLAGDDFGAAISYQKQLD